MIFTWSLAEAFKIPASRNLRLALSLLFVTVATIVIMTVFQIVKHILHADMNMWESHIYTNTFASILAPLITLFVLLRFEDLYRRVLEENEERKKTEKALRENQSLLRAITDGSPDPIFVKDRESRILFGNPALFRVFGKPPEEVIGKTDRELYADPAISEAIMSNDRHVLETNRSIAIEEAVQDTDGIRTYLSTKTPYHDSNGNTIGIFGIARDITERKRMEGDRERLLKVVEEQRARLQAIVDSMPVGLWIADAAGNIILINNNARTIWGGKTPYTEDIKEHCNYKARWADTGEPVQAEDMPIARAIRGEKCQDKVIDFERFDGTMGTELVSAVPIVTQDQRIIGSIAIIQDISEMKRKEEELKAARSKAELYLDLMGHDINNMHQVALGYLEMLMDQPPEERRDDIIRKPVEVLNRSSRLIKNVMKLQKLSDRTYADKDIDVCRVLADVYSEHGAAGKRIRMNMNGHEKCVVRANELLHDVFTNLVGNAIKHTGEGTEISVDLNRVADDGRRYCRVAVEDNGPGILDDHKLKIFNRMHKGSTRGMGLGLYLVKSLVDSYGGKVWVEDRVKGEYSKGARFVVMIPDIGI